MNPSEESQPSSGVAVNELPKLSESFCVETGDVAWDAVGNILFVGATTVYDAMRFQKGEPDREVLFQKFRKAASGSKLMSGRVIQRLGPQLGAGITQIQRDITDWVDDVLAFVRKGLVTPVFDSEQFVTMMDRFSSLTQQLSTALNVSWRLAEEARRTELSMPRSRAITEFR